MSDTGTQVPILNGGGSSSSSADDQAQVIATRMKIITGLHPYMAKNPAALAAFAGAPISTNEVINNAVQMYGMQVGNEFATQLDGMTPEQQRSIWPNLTKSQQMGLTQIGYKNPLEEDTSLLGTIGGAFGDVASIAGGVLKGGLNLASTVGKPIVSPALEGLAWVGNWPGHLYRSIRLMDEQQQWLGLVGGIAGLAAAAAFAPITGGGSLAAFGALGGGALLGATAGAALTAPGDWARAFNTSWNGERTFDRASRSRADELLGDPRLVGLAHDLAIIPGFSLDDLATELASMKDGANQGQQLAKLNELASRMDAPGSPGYQKAYEAMLNALEIPQFKEAVAALQDGKMSPGRDLMDALPGIDKDSTLYRIGSGAVDLSFTLAVDPLLIAGEAHSAYRAATYGVKMSEGSLLATQLTKVFEKPSVVRLHEEILNALGGIDDIADISRLRSIAPEYERLLPELRDHMEVLKTTGSLRGGRMDLPQFREFLTGNAQLSPLLRGIGGVRSADRIVVAHWGALRGPAREFMGSIRSLTYGLADPAMERAYVKQALKAGETNPEMLSFLPEGMADDLTAHGQLDLPWRYANDEDKAYRFGRKIGEVPKLGTALGRAAQALSVMTTMAPAGRAIKLAGEEAVRDVHAMTELGQLLGMPSWVRQAWRDAILSSTSTAAKQELAIGWLDNALTLAGGRSAPRMRELTDLFIEKAKQLYGFGDEMMVNGKVRHVGLFTTHTADEIVMPSLTQLRKYAMSGNIAKFVGISDLSVADTAMNKVWKPAVLLRAAFIPRAAGEEMMAFFLRGGVGSLGQDFAARSIAERIVWDAAHAKVAAGDAAKLTAGELTALKRGANAALPTHVRWLQRIMDHTSWADPTYGVLDRYGQIVRGGLERGIGIGERIDSRLSALAGVEDLHANRALTSWRPKAGSWRVNAVDHVDSLLLGNPNSWRRMVTGGVNRDIIDAAIEWQSLHRTTMMRALSTTTTGAGDELIRDPATATYRQVPDGDGGYIDVPAVRLTGERELANIGDEAYDGHWHRLMTEPFEDPTQAGALAQMLPLLRGPHVTLTDAQILEILTPLRSASPPLRVLMHEFLSAPNIDTWRAAIRQISSKYPELGETLKLLPGNRLPSIDDVLHVVDRYRTGLMRPWEADLQAEAAARAAGEVDLANPIEPGWFKEQLDRKAMTPAERRRLQDDYHARLEDDSRFAPQPEPVANLAEPKSVASVLDAKTMTPAERQAARDDMRARLEDDTRWDQTEHLHPNMDELLAAHPDAHGAAQAWENDEAFWKAHMGEYQDEVQFTGYSPGGVGAPVDASGQSVGPRRLEELDKEYLDTIKFEDDQAKIQFSPDETDVATYRTDQIAVREQATKDMEEALQRHAGGAMSRDARTGQPTFNLRPTNAGEWDFWRQLTPNQRRSLGMRYFRNNGGIGTPIDVLASEAGMTPAEWTDKFMDLLARHQTARRELSEARKLSRRGWRTEYQTSTLREMDAMAPGRTSAEVKAELDALNSSDMGRRYRQQQQLGEQMSAQEAEQRALGNVDYGPEPAIPSEPLRGKAARDAERAQVPPPVYEEGDSILAAAGSGTMVPSTYHVNVDPVSIDEFHQQLSSIAPSLRRIAEMNDHDRGFIGAAARSMDRPGSGLRLKDLERSLTEPDAAPMFYDQWDDAFHQRLVDELTGQAMNPYNNARTEQMLRTGGAETGLNKPTVPVYAITMRQPAAGGELTYDSILANAGNKDVIARNRETIEKMLSTEQGIMTTGGEAGIARSNLTYGVPDVELARELNDTMRLIAGLPAESRRAQQVVQLDARILDGRLHDGVMPLHKTRDTTTLWSLDNEIYAGRLQPIPLSREQQARQWAQDTADELRVRLTRNTESWRTARGTVNKKGEEVPVLFTQAPDGSLHGVAPGERLESGRLYFDKKGRRLSDKEVKFYNIDATKAADGVVPWEAVGPMVEDFWDTRLGMERLAPKQQYSFGSGKAIASEDKVRVFRSRREQMGRLGDSRPPVVYGEKIITPTPEKGWDKFVRYGFDKMIGPGIDSLARRPMAFHYFKQRFTQNMELTKWLADPALESAVSSARDLVATRHGLDQEKVASVVKRVAHIEGDDNALTWTTNEALAWLRGHSPDEIGEMVGRANRLGGRPGALPDRELQKDARWFLEQKPSDVITLPGVDMNPREFLGYVESQLPAHTLDAPQLLDSGAARKVISEHPTLRHLSDKDWESLVAYRRNIAHIRKTASENAATAAMNDMMPFIDSHEFKTQFAEFGKGFLPFWYAEENFMKRWARGLADMGPGMVRRAQLSYMGLKEAGVVRTDANGRDWFVYPGSTLLANAIDKIHPGLGLAAGGIMFQTPTDSLLPGVNDRFGTPAFNPLVTVPVDLATAMFPELSPVNNALQGQFGDRNLLTQLVPSQVMNIYGALFGNEKTNKRYVAAMTAAIAQREAAGTGLADDATPGERDEYMRDIRNHARIILTAQAIGGFFTPGAPSAVNAAESANVLGLGVENPAELLSSSYVQLVRGLGIEEGTAKFLELYPQATVQNIVNPLVYTQSRTETRSGAQIGSTQDALDWYDTNGDYLDALPNATPWLLPQNYLDGPRAETAYDSQLVNGLRTTKTPTEFLTSLKFKEASTEYFDARTKYLDNVAKAEMADNVEQVRELKRNWSVWSTTYQAAHPVFADELVSGDGRARRASVLEELRVAIDDPLAPASTRLDQIRKAVKFFDQYKTALAVLSDDHTNAGQAKVDALKQRYSNAMDAAVRADPTLRGFWVSILRPEASLD